MTPADQVSSPRPGWPGASTTHPHNETTDSPATGGPARSDADTDVDRSQPACQPAAPYGALVTRARDVLAPTPATTPDTTSETPQ